MQVLYLYFIYSQKKKIMKKKRAIGIDCVHGVYSVYKGKTLKWKDKVLKLKI